MIKTTKSALLLVTLFFGANTLAVEIKINQGTSLLGKPLISSKPDPIKQSQQIANYNNALNHYRKNTNSADAIIWLGRRIAYLGDYQKAIEIYSDGISKHPKDARMFRHRGHRYISTRQLDKAIEDFEHAARLIKNSADQIEPDGIPNAQNVPVSSLHSNIWYHLGLAYYLNNDLDNAESAFDQCLKTLRNDDNLVSASHWAYMIAREKKDQLKAKKLLSVILKDTNVIENFAYLKLLKFYKSEINEKQLLANHTDGVATSEATLYGLGNWYLYNGSEEQALEIFKRILDSGHWAAFGTIAAEAQLSRRNKPDS